MNAFVKKIVDEIGRWTIGKLNGKVDKNASEITIRNTKNNSSTVGKIYGSVSDNLFIKPTIPGAEVVIDGMLDVNDTVDVHGKINGDGLSISGQSTFYGKINAEEISTSTVLAENISVSGSISLDGGVHTQDESTFNGKILSKGGISVQDGDLYVEDKASLHGGLVVRNGVEFNSNGHNNAFVIDSIKVKARMDDWLSAALEYTKKRINFVAPEVRWVQKVLQSDGTYTDKEHLLSSKISAIDNLSESITVNGDSITLLGVEFTKSQLQALKNLIG